jgi:RNA polymerase sigma-70 factor (ECF subfamily)
MTLGNDFDSILLAARSGAEWAWSRLYSDLAPTVLRYLRSRGTADPEDLTGEVFLQVVRRLDQFHGSEAEFRSWVVTIAHRRSIDAHRAKTRRPVDPIDDAAMAAIAGVVDVQTEALGNLANREMLRALAGLSQDQRDVLFLRILAGLSIAEVAAAVGKSPGAVKSLQSRAVGALRRRMPDPDFAP